MFIALLFIVLFIMGIAATFFPYQMWEITEAWQYKDREANEPSDLRLVLWRVGGDCTTRPVASTQRPVLSAPARS